MNNKEVKVTHYHKMEILCDRHRKGGEVLCEQCLIDKKVEFGRELMHHLRLMGIDHCTKYIEHWIESEVFLTKNSGDELP